jgi:hypothetical protein
MTVEISDSSRSLTKHLVGHLALFLQLTELIVASDQLSSDIKITVKL